jgi:hypothetical protein
LDCPRTAGTLAIETAGRSCCRGKSCKEGEKEERERERTKNNLKSINEDGKDNRREQGKRDTKE